MVWKLDDSKGNESSKIRWEIVPYTKGRGLDLGCGPNKAFPHFIGVDNCHHEQFGYQIKPDFKVETCEKLDAFASQSMDFVFSSHLIEHIENHKAALKEWWRLIKVGGYMVLYYPHKDFYPNIGTPGSNPDHKHDFMPQDIIDVMEDMSGCGWDLVENQERNDDDEYSVFQVFKKLGSQKHLYSYKRDRPEKSAAVIRYGAFGDLMQASSVFAGLKKLGYHVTLYSSLPGADVVCHDPNIDEVVLQDRDQVPNGSLGDFWAHLKKKYDRFINLSESVEGSLLAMAGRAQHEWPKDVRHDVMNKNYVEFQHKLAGVPHEPKIKFYATDDEKEWAKKQRSKMGEFVIIWSLAGSAVHKTWPYLDNIIAGTLLCYPTAHIVLVGGPECVILEGGWDNEPRVHKTCGKWSIRQTLSFLEHADLIIGPETGVLNAACNLPQPKIVFLSHSTIENLTRDWINTVSLFSETTDCYPCHILHQSWKTCKKNTKTIQELIPALANMSSAQIPNISAEGVAECQASIGPDTVWLEVERIMNELLSKRAA